MFLSDEDSVGRTSVDSNDASVSIVGINDVIGGLVANANEVKFYGYFVCLISLWNKRLAHTNVKNFEKMKYIIT